MQRIAYILLIVQFLLKKRYTKKDVMGVFLIVFMCFLGYHSVYNKYIIHTMILVYMSANVDFRKILKCTLVLQGTFMVITVFASHMEVIENVIWDSDSTRIRQSLGYDYCGYPAHLMLFMTLMWFCLRKKVHLLDVVFGWLLNYLIYLRTDSRADYYLSIIAIIGFLLIKNKYKMQFWMKYGCFIISLFSFGIHLLYGIDNWILNRINVGLSNRLYLGYEAIKNYGIGLFGKTVKWVGQGSFRNNSSLVYNYVDCAFLKELISYGLLFWLIVCIGFFYVNKVLIDTVKMQYYAWTIVITLFYAVINAHLCMPVFNVFILIVGKMFLSELYNEI